MEYVLSLATNKKHAVYHTEACPYAKRIKFKNKMMVSYFNINASGYKPCACCNNDNRYLKLWLQFFEGKGYHDLEIRQFDSRVAYIRTKAGFWKIFLADNREYVLYHRNVFEKDKSFDELIHGSFHRQQDVKGTHSLEKILNYIKEHDKAKVIMDELIKYGVPKERLSYVGKGSSNPIDTSKDPKNRWKNRRVEFSIKKKK